MDTRLITLADSVEAGASCTPINLAVGQWIVQGTPVSSTEFLSRTHASLGRFVVEQLPGRDRRQVLEGQADHVWQTIMHQTAEMIAPLMNAPAGPGGALSLVDVTMTGGMAGVVCVSAVRVSLDSIDLWWMANFQHETAKIGGGGGVSVGF